MSHVTEWITHHWMDYTVGKNHSFKCQMLCLHLGNKKDPVSADWHMGVLLYPEIVNILQEWKKTHTLLTQNLFPSTSLESCWAHSQLFFRWMIAMVDLFSWWPWPWPWCDLWPWFDMSWRWDRQLETGTWRSSRGAIVFIDSGPCWLV